MRLNASLNGFTDRIDLVEVLIRKHTAPVVKSGYHLRFPTSYPGFESRRAHQIPLAFGSSMRVRSNGYASKAEVGCSPDASIHAD